VIVFAPTLTFTASEMASLLINILRHHRAQIIPAFRRVSTSISVNNISFAQKIEKQEKSRQENENYVDFQTVVVRFSQTAFSSQRPQRL
jgi:hypothetical protein